MRRKCCREGEPVVLVKAGSDDNCGTGLGVYVVAGHTAPVFHVEPCFSCWGFEGPGAPADPGTDKLQELGCTEVVKTSASPHAHNVRLPPGLKWNGQNGLIPEVT